MSTEGILSGTSIKRALSEGQIVVDPYREDRVNPYSYDLTLGRKVSVYSRVTYGTFSKIREQGVTGEDLQPWACSNPNIPLEGLAFHPSGHLDAAIQNEVRSHELEPGEAFFLRPGIGYLMHTEERVWTDSFVPVLDGKSSLARLFASAHVTAGYGEANFNGQWTLEVVVTHPLIVYAGMRFCQMRFHTIAGDKDQYDGNYQGKDAVGPVPSKSWKQIEDDGLLKGKR